jgi:multiple sugar transport system permease protein
MSRPRRRLHLGRAIAIVLIVAWSVSPVLVGISTSLSAPAEVTQVPTRWLPADPSSRAYSALLSDQELPGPSSGGTASDPSDFRKALINSVTLTTLATVSILCVSVLAGYGFSRLRFRGSSTLMWVIVATMLVPIFVTVVTIFKVMANLHLIDTKLGLVLVLTASQVPLGIWLAYYQCRELPADTIEAAMLDGCGPWRSFVRVALPQLRSGIAAMSAIFMLAVWGEFLTPLLLAPTLNTKPVTVMISELVGKYSTNYPVLAAAGVIALIPPAIVALVLNRQIRGVLTGSS